MSAKYPRPKPQPGVRPAPAMRTVNLNDFPPGMVAVPTLEWMWSKSALALIGLSHSLPPGSRVSMSCGTSHSIATNRNLLIEKDFLPRRELEWVYFSDADMVPPATAVVQLLARQKDFITGLYCTRQEPYPIAARLDDAVADTCHRVRSAGLGCALVRRRVFERISPPWFEHPFSGGGEDTYFCEKAAEAGIEIWLDRSVEVGHVTLTDLRMEFAAAWQATPSGRASVREFLQTDAADWARYEAGKQRLREEAHRP